MDTVLRKSRSNLTLDADASASQKGSPLDSKHRPGLSDAKWYLLVDSKGKRYGYQQILMFHHQIRAYEKGSPLTGTGLQGGGLSTSHGTNGSGAAAPDEFQEGEAGKSRKGLAAAAAPADVDVKVAA